jgi:hypothetical protein
VNAHEKAQIEFLNEIMATQEDLDPELVPWMNENGPFGPSLKHPLVFSVIHPPTMNAMVNMQLKQKKQALREAKARRQWHRYVFLYERPYRLDAFMNISWGLDGPEYWKLLGDVWSDTENCWQNVDEWREMLTADPEGREMMSTEDVRSVFELTPEAGGLAPQTRVYRGYCYEGALASFSWTLDRARAKWFATRLRQDDDPPAKVASGFIAREHVIAYVTGRDEQEIVCLPEHVTELEIKEL